MKFYTILLIISCFSLGVFAQMGRPVEAFDTRNGASLDGQVRTSNFQNVFQLQDGSYCVLGEFGEYQGKAHRGIFKLLANGERDDDFSFFMAGQHSFTGGVEMNNEDLYFIKNTSPYLFRTDKNGQNIHYHTAGNGPNGLVKEIFRDRNNRLYIYGDFTKFGTANVPGFCRLNADGSLDLSFVLPAQVPSEIFGLIHMADGRIFVYGSFTMYAGQQAKGAVFLNDNGSVHTRRFQGVTDPVISGAALRNDGKIVAITSSTQSVNDLILMDADGSEQMLFESNTGNGHIYLDDEQTDIIVDKYNGIYVANGTMTSGPNQVFGFFKTNAQGQIDGSFNLNMSNAAHNMQLCYDGDSSIVIVSDNNAQGVQAGNDIYACNLKGELLRSFHNAIDSDFKPTELGSMMFLKDSSLLITGSFNKFSGLDAPGWARVHRTTGERMIYNATTSTATTQKVHKAHDGPNGTIYLVGEIMGMHGGSNIGITRVFPMGSVDPTFSSSLTSTDNVVRAIDVLADGRIVIGGKLFDGNSTKNLQILSDNGTSDIQFNFLQAGPNGEVYDVLVDGNLIYLAGDFTSYNGTFCSSLIRINLDGTLDNTFSPSFNGRVTKIVKDASGSMVCLGDFTRVNGVNQGMLARLNPDGTLDQTLNIGSGFNGPINDFDIAQDGSFLVVGSFTEYNGQIVQNVVYMNSNGVASLNMPLGYSDKEVYEVRFVNNDKAVLRGKFQRYGPLERQYTVKIDLTCESSPDPEMIYSQVHFCDSGVFEAQVDNDLYPGESFQWFVDNINGSVLSTSDEIQMQIDGPNTFYVRKIGGCTGDSELDSVTVSLSVSDTSYQTEVRCGSYFWPTSGKTYTESTVDSVLLQTVSGCDSMAFLSFTRERLDTIHMSIVQDSNKVVLTTNASEFEWLDYMTSDVVQIGGYEYYPPESGMFEVRTQSASGLCEKYSNYIIYVEPEESTSGLDEQTLADVQLYPNPFKNDLSIVSSVDFDRYELMDLNGKIVREGQVSTSIISLNNLDSGTYFLRLIGAGNVLVRKVVRE